MIIQLGIKGTEKAAIPTRMGSAPTGVEYDFTLLSSSSLGKSILTQLRDRFRERNLRYPGRYAHPLHRLPVTEMKPWFVDLPRQLRALFAKPKPLQVSVEPLRLPDMWADYQPQRASWVNSLLAHMMIMAIVVVPFWIRSLSSSEPDTEVYEIIDLSPYMQYLRGSDQQAGGGGGGGDLSPTPAPKGGAPKFDLMQFTPPQVVLKNLQPVLQEDPTILGPPDLKLPQMNLAQLGDPMGPDWTNPAQGPGFGGGIGSGEGTGIGSGTGGGLGPGRGGGLGGGVYSVGGNVAAPVPIYQPEPPYSEEARKAKYQGTVVLLIVVDQKGNVRNVQVFKPLGLGLDEKAVETVRTWKFRPAMRNNNPVAVRVSVEVTFRLY